MGRDCSFQKCLLGWDGPALMRQWGGRVGSRWPRAPRSLCAIVKNGNPEGTYSSWSLAGSCFSLHINLPKRCSHIVHWKIAVCSVLSPASPHFTTLPSIPPSQFQLIPLHSLRLMCDIYLCMTQVIVHFQFAFCDFIVCIFTSPIFLSKTTSRWKRAKIDKLYTYCCLLTHCLIKIIIQIHAFIYLFGRLEMTAYKKHPQNFFSKISRIISTSCSIHWDFLLCGCLWMTNLALFSL